MLDDFKFEQEIAYKTILNSISLNKISHAYIIESNGYPKSFDFALAVAKTFLCPKLIYKNSIECENCNQCKNIDNNDFLELKIIKPEGMWIKKNELIELQDIFSKKSIIGNRKVYIIESAEKLNVSSSNSILKFLEEPEEGITAILLVNNISQLLPTIVSRCQILSLSHINTSNNLSTLEKIAHYLKNNDIDIKEYISNDENISKIDKIIEFIKNYEENHLKTLIYINKLWHQFFKEKNEFYDAFTIMLLFYKDILNKLIGGKIIIFNDYEQDLLFLEKNMTKDTVVDKINVIMDLREKIKFNINNNLLMDKLIIELEGCEINE